MRPLTVFVAALAWLATLHCARAADVSVAVAANFAAPMQKIAVAFSRSTQHRALLVVGATGAFHAQIRNGAPFDVLLAADGETPARLEQEGLAVKGTRFTYATGRLVLWSALEGIDPKDRMLRNESSERVAIANPKLAPYGAAALETMAGLRVYDRLQPRIVQGESVGQAFQMTASGNAAFGFVALSQIMSDGRITRGSAWVVPESLHAPLRQDAVLLDAGKGNAGASALLAFLKTESARSIMRGYGYLP